MDHIKNVPIEKWGETKEDLVDVITHHLSARVVAYAINLTDIHKLKITKFYLIEEKQELQFYLDVHLTVTLTQEFLSALNINLKKSEIAADVKLEVGVIATVDEHLLNGLTKKGIDYLHPIYYTLESEVLNTNTIIQELTDTITGEAVPRFLYPNMIIQDLIKNIPYKVELKVEHAAGR